MVCDMTVGSIKCFLHVVLHSVTLCGSPKTPLVVFFDMLRIWEVMVFATRSNTKPDMS